MKQFDKDNYAYNLPDCYAKGEDSNNYKILYVEKTSIDGLESDIEAVNNSLDLDEATGKTLDLFGETVNQPRGLANDAQYRLMIRAKIMRNLSGGDYTSVMQAMCMTFNCDPSELVLTETGEACKVEITKLPLGVIFGADLTADQALQIINTLLPVGVSIVAFYFEGTFEFGEGENETDTEKGFSDGEGEIGGYFGIMAGEEDEPVLPIE